MRESAYSQWRLTGPCPVTGLSAGGAKEARSYRPEWEAEMLDLARVFEYLANCRWFRRIRANGRLDLGGCDY